MEKFVSNFQKIIFYLLRGNRNTQKPNSPYLIVLFKVWLILVFAHKIGYQSQQKTATSKNNAAVYDSYFS